jgi:hypothetical protein
MVRGGRSLGPRLRIAAARVRPRGDLPSGIRVLRSSHPLSVGRRHRCRRALDGCGPRARPGRRPLVPRFRRYRRLCSRFLAPVSASKRYRGGLRRTARLRRCHSRDERRAPCALCREGRRPRARRLGCVRAYRSRCRTYPATIPLAIGSGPTVLVAGESNAAAAPCSKRYDLWPGAAEDVRRTLTTEAPPPAPGPSQNLFAVRLLSRTLRRCRARNAARPRL